MNPHEPDGHAPAPKRRKRFPKLLFIPIVMMGLGYLVGGFFVKASPKVAHDETHEEEHRPDPTIDDTIGEQRWKEAIVKIRADLRTADGPQSIPLKFREAVCHERLGDYSAAAMAFTEVIAADPSSVRGVAARISWARCQVKLNRLSDARGALARLMLLSGDDGTTASPLHADLLATIAHVEYLSGGQPTSPHPLSAYQPATTEKIPDLEQLIVWAGPLPKPKPAKKHGASHGDDSHGHDAHSASDDHGHAPAADDDHGKKPAASKNHAEDDHGKKPASSKSDHAEDDHGKKPAASKNHAEDDHGKKLTAPAKEDDHGKKPATSKNHAEDDHGKKPANPAKEDDHGKKPAAPAKEDDHGKKPAAPVKEDDHGKKPAAPAKEDDHGKKPAAPAKPDHSVVAIQDTTEISFLDPAKVEEPAKKPVAAAKVDDHADDHGKKPIAPAKVDDHADDHGKKPVAPVKVDEHGKKPSTPAKDDHADDHGKKPIAPAKVDDHADDHGKKPVAPVKVEEHGKKPSTPAKEDHADDHGKKPVAPAKAADHGKKPVVAAKADDHADDHGQKPATAKVPSLTKEAVTKPKKEIRIKPSDKPGEWLVSADIQSRGLRVVTETLARELGLDLKLTGIADELLSGKAANILVTDLPASQILDSLLHPAEVEWKIADLDLIVSPLNKGESAWRERARRAIERFLAVETDHTWKTGLTIDLGNLDFQAKNWKAAFDVYVRALDEGGLKPEAVAANYNLGLSCIHLSLRDRAREQFQNLVDRDTSGRWSALAYWWAGRTHLDVDEPDRGIKYFEAALDTGETGNAIAASALGLAFCYLMKDDYESALKVIRPYREALRQRDYKLTAAYVDALCRYKRAENPKVTGEADEILYAVLNVTEELAVGPAGEYQLGKTCRELGFGPRMVIVYSRTLESLRGALAIRMTRELADYEYSDGDPEKALEGYQAIAAINREEPGRHARLQLARIAIRNKRAEEAGQYCLDAMRVGADRDAILKELGKVYELKKDYVRAAKCFAGEFP